MVKELRRLFLGLFLLCTAIVVHSCIKISNYSYQFSDAASDAAIVLGAGVWQDKPSPVFKARIDHGINLYHQDRVKVLVFTGGVGRDKKFAEADVAETYAIAQGVKPQDILTETHSKITFENLQEAKNLLDEAKLKTVLLVSDPLHMKRAMTMAKDLNIEAAPSPTPTSRYQSWRTKTGFLAREVYYYLGYLLFK